jgi:hypothetical protein
MWGKLMPKRGQSKFAITPIGNEVFDLLSSKENHILNIVDYPYAGIYWRACPNI